MKTNKVVVEKLVLDINGNKIELSLDEANQLKEALKEFFNEKEIVYLPQPYTIKPYIYKWYQPVEIWSDTSGTHGTITVSNTNYTIQNN